MTGIPDLSSGLDPGVEAPITDPAVGAATGENHAFWMFDGTGALALLNCHLQAGDSAGYSATTAHGQRQQGNPWATRREAFSFVLPGQRLLVGWATGTRTTKEGPGAAGWHFRCEQPFTRWTGSYRGAARVTTPDELQAGVLDMTSGTKTPVECDLELTMVVPAWVNGTFAEDLPGREAALLFQGVPRYEQLYRATGTLVVDGQTHHIDGTGLRTHRYGRRDVSGITGHSWLSAVFPDGRAFGLLRFPSREGGILYSEGWTAEPGGSPVEARVVESPWMTSLSYSGEEFRVLLETAVGPTEIRGTVVATSYSMGLGVNRQPGSWVIGHAMAQYTWHGQQTFGLLERSAPFETLR